MEWVDWCGEAMVQERRRRRVSYPRGMRMLAPSKQTDVFVDAPSLERPNPFMQQGWFDQSLADVVKKISRLPLLFAPGEDVQYSNAAWHQPRAVTHSQKSTTSNPGQF